jgi:hypothetical protein
MCNHIVAHRERKRNSPVAAGHQARTAYWPEGAHYEEPLCASAVLETP